MRALVTGGAGFIGSTLVDRLLADDYAVDVVDDLSAGSLTNLATARREHSRRLSFHRLDIRSPDLVEVMDRRRPDVVFHLASRRSASGARADPLDEAGVNLMGTLQVLEAARICGAKKVVFASGAAIYGPVGAGELPVKESHPERPTSGLGVAKKAVFDYLRSYRDGHSLEFSALALSSVYGPRQRGQGEGGVVVNFVTQLLAGEDCTVEGDGRQTCDFVYVDDVVDAFARAGGRGSGLLLNVSTGIQTSISALYAVAASAVGVDRDPLRGPPRPSGSVRSALDPARASLHLGWTPWTPLSEGVGALVESVRNS